MESKISSLSIGGFQQLTPAKMETQIEALQTTVQQITENVTQFTKNLQIEINNILGFSGGVGGDILKYSLKGVLDQAAVKNIEMGLLEIESKIQSLYSEATDLWNQKYMDTDIFLLQDVDRYKLDVYSYESRNFNSLNNDILVLKDYGKQEGPRTALEIFRDQLYNEENPEDLSTLWGCMYNVVYKLITTDIDNDPENGVQILDYLLEDYATINTTITNHINKLSKCIVVAKKCISESYNEIQMQQLSKTKKELSNEIEQAASQMVLTEETLNEFKNTVEQSLKDGILTEAEIKQIKQLRTQLMYQVTQLRDEADDLLQASYIGEAAVNSSVDSDETPEVKVIPLIDDSGRYTFAALNIDDSRGGDYVITWREYEEGEKTMEDGKDAHSCYGVKSALDEAVEIFCDLDLKSTPEDNTNLWDCFYNCVEKLCSEDADGDPNTGIQIMDKWRDNYDIMLEQLMNMITRISDILVVARMRSQEIYDQIMAEKTAAQVKLIQDDITDQVNEATQSLSSLGTTLSGFKNSISDFLQDGLINVAELAAIKNLHNQLKLQVLQVKDECDDLLFQTYADGTQLLDDVAEGRYIFNKSQYFKNNDYPSGNVLYRSTVDPETDTEFGTQGIRSQLSDLLTQLYYEDGNDNVLTGSEERSIWYNFTNCIMALTDSGLVSSTSKIVEVDSQLVTEFEIMYDIFNNHMQYINQCVVLANDRISERYNSNILDIILDVSTAIYHDLEQASQSITSVNESLSTFKSSVNSFMSDGVLEAAELKTIDLLKTELYQKVLSAIDECDDLFSQTDSEGNSLLTSKLGNEFSYVYIPDASYNNVIQRDKALDDHGAVRMVDISTALHENLLQLIDITDSTKSDTIWNKFSVCVQTLMDTDIDPDTSVIDISTGAKNEYLKMYDVFNVHMQELNHLISKAKIEIQNEYNSRAVNMINNVGQSLEQRFNASIGAVIDKAMASSEFATQLQDSILKSVEDNVLTTAEIASIKAGLSDLELSVDQTQQSINQILSIKYNENDEKYLLEFATNKFNSLIWDKDYNIDRYSREIKQNESVYIGLYEALQQASDILKKADSEDTVWGLYKKCVNDMLMDADDDPDNGTQVSVIIKEQNYPNAYKMYTSHFSYLVNMLNQARLVVSKLYEERSASDIRSVIDTSLNMLSGEFAEANESLSTLQDSFSSFKDNVSTFMADGVLKAAEITSIKNSLNDLRYKVQVAVDQCDDLIDQTITISTGNTYTTYNLLDPNDDETINTPIYGKFDWDETHHIAEGQSLGRNNAYRSLKLQCDHLYNGVDGSDKSLWEYFEICTNELIADASAAISEVGYVKIDEDKAFYYQTMYNLVEEQMLWLEKIISEARIQSQNNHGVYQAIQFNDVIDQLNSSISRDVAQAMNAVNNVKEELTDYRQNAAQAAADGILEATELKIIEVTESQLLSRVISCWNEGTDLLTQHYVDPSTGEKIDLLDDSVYAFNNVTYSKANKDTSAYVLIRNVNDSSDYIRTALQDSLSQLYNNIEDPSTVWYNFDKAVYTLTHYDKEDKFIEKGNIVKINEKHLTNYYCAHDVFEEHIQDLEKLITVASKRIQEHYNEISNNHVSEFVDFVSGQVAEAAASLESATNDLTTFKTRLNDSLADSILEYSEIKFIEQNLNNLELQIHQAQKELEDIYNMADADENPLLDNLNYQVNSYSYSIGSKPIHDGTDTYSYIEEKTISVTGIRDAIQNDIATLDDKFIDGFTGGANAIAIYDVFESCVKALCESDMDGDITNGVNIDEDIKKDYIATYDYLRDYLENVAYHVAVARKRLNEIYEENAEKYANEQIILLDSSVGDRLSVLDSNFDDLDAAREALQQKVDTAEEEINAMSSDGILSKLEKQQLIPTINDISANHYADVEMANSLTKVKDSDIFKNENIAFNDLYNFLDSSCEVFETDKNTVIPGDRYDLNAKFDTWYQLNVQLDKYIDQVKTELQNSNYTQLINGISGDLESLKNQIDNEVNSWFMYPYPTTDNAPACDWDDEEKQLHVGDTYTNLHGETVNILSRNLWQTGYNSNLTTNYYKSASKKPYNNAKNYISTNILLTIYESCTISVKEDFQSTGWQVAVIQYEQDGDFVSGVQSNVLEGLFKNTQQTINASETNAKHIAIIVRNQDPQAANDSILHDDEAFDITSILDINPMVTFHNGYSSKSWRWIPADEDVADYHWHIISDTDAARALVLASQAQAAADGKMTFFTNSGKDNDYPVNYKTGDMWIKDGDGDMLFACRNYVDVYKSADWQPSKYLENINSAAVGAAGVAEQAKLMASAATGVLDQMASDNVIVKQEKSRLKTEWATIKAQHSNTINAAAKYNNVSTFILEQNYNTLSEYLVGAPGALGKSGLIGWLGEVTAEFMARDTTIDPETFNTTFANWYAENASVLNAVAIAAAEDVSTIQGQKYDNVVKDISTLDANSKQLSQDISAAKSSIHAMTSDDYISIPEKEQLRRTLADISIKYDYDMSIADDLSSYISRKIISNTTDVFNETVKFLKEDCSIYNSAVDTKLSETQKTNFNTLFTIYYNQMSSLDTAIDKARSEKEEDDRALAIDAANAELQKEIADNKSYVDTISAKLQNQIDGVIDSYFLETPPPTSFAYKPLCDWINDASSEMEWSASDLSTIKTSHNVSTGPVSTTYGTNIKKIFDRHIGDTYTDVLPAKVELGAKNIAGNAGLWFELGGLRVGSGDGYTHVGKTFEDQKFISSKMCRTRGILHADTDVLLSNVDKDCPTGSNAENGTGYERLIIFYDNMKYNKNWAWTVSTNPETYNNRTNCIQKGSYFTLMYQSLKYPNSEDRPDLVLSEISASVVSGSISYVNAGKSWRFCAGTDNNETGGYHWHTIADSDAVLALQAAAKAQDTADGKRTVFNTQPSNYSEGDLWIAPGADISICTTSSATFNANHWVKATKYTDDSAIENLEIGATNLLYTDTFSVTTTNNDKTVYKLLYGYFGKTTKPIGLSNVIDELTEGQYILSFDKIKKEPIANRVSTPPTDSSLQFRLFAYSKSSADAGDIQYPYIEVASYVVSAGDNINIKINVPGPHAVFKNAGAIQQPWSYGIIAYAGKFGECTGYTVTYVKPMLIKGNVPCSYVYPKYLQDLKVDSSIQNLITSNSSLQKQIDDASRLLSDIGSDGKITASEKTSIRTTLADISVNFDSDIQLAKTFGISNNDDVLVNASTAFQSLKNYLINDIKVNESTTVVINASTYNTKFNDYYKTNKILDAAIAEAKKSSVGNIVPNADFAYSSFQDKNGNTITAVRNGSYASYTQKYDTNLNKIYTSISIAANAPISSGIYISSSSSPYKQIQAGEVYTLTFTAKTSYTDSNLSIGFEYKQDATGNLTAISPNPFRKTLKCGQQWKTYSYVITPDTSGYLRSFVVYTAESYPRAITIDICDIRLNAGNAAFDFDIREADKFAPQQNVLKVDQYLTSLTFAIYEPETGNMYCMSGNDGSGNLPKNTDNTKGNVVLKFQNSSYTDTTSVVYKYIPGTNINDIGYYRFQRPSDAAFIVLSVDGDAYYSSIRIDLKEFATDDQLVLSFKYRMKKLNGAVIENIMLQKGTWYSEQYIKPLYTYVTNNKLKGTRHFDDKYLIMAKNNYDYSLSATDSPVKGFYTYKFTNTKTYTELITFSASSGSANQLFVWTFWAKSNNAGTVLKSFIYKDEDHKLCQADAYYDGETLKFDDTKSAKHSGSVKIPLTTHWKKYIIMNRLSSEASSVDSFRIFLRANPDSKSDAAGTTVELSQIKLANSNIVGEWSEYPDFVPESRENNTNILLHSDVPEMINWDGTSEGNIKTKQDGYYSIKVSTTGKSHAYAHLIYQKDDTHDINNLTVSNIQSYQLTISMDIWSDTGFPYGGVPLKIGYHCFTKTPSTNNSQIYKYCEQTVSSGKWTRISMTTDPFPFDIGGSFYKDIVNRMYIVVKSAAKMPAGSELRIKNIKLERNSAASSWYLAPEDTAAGIASNQYLQAAMENNTDIQGGLMLTSIIQLRDQANKVQAGLSGMESIRVSNSSYLATVSGTTPSYTSNNASALKDDTLLWAGGDYSDAWKDQTGISSLPVRITKSGINSHIGPFKVTSTNSISIGSSMTISTNSIVTSGIQIGGSENTAKAVSLTATGINSHIGPFKVTSTNSISVGDNIKISSVDISVGPGAYFHKSGSGNLANRNIYWNTDGDVTMKASLQLGEQQTLNYGLDLSSGKLVLSSSDTSLNAKVYPVNITQDGAGSNIGPMHVHSLNEIIFAEKFGKMVDITINYIAPANSSVYSPLFEQSINTGVNTGTNIKVINDNYQIGLGKSDEASKCNIKVTGYTIPVFYNKKITTYILIPKLYASAYSGVNDDVKTFLAFKSSDILVEDSALHQTETSNKTMYKIGRNKDGVWYPKSPNANGDPSTFGARYKINFSNLREGYDPHDQIRVVVKSPADSENTTDGDPIQPGQYRTTISTNNIRFEEYLPENWYNKCSKTRKSGLISMNLQPNGIFFNNYNVTALTYDTLCLDNLKIIACNGANYPSLNFSNKYLSFDSDYEVILKYNATNTKQIGLKDTITALINRVKQLEHQMEGLIYGILSSSSATYTNFRSTINTLAKLSAKTTNSSYVMPSGSTLIKYYNYGFDASTTDLYKLPTAPNKLQGNSNHFDNLNNYTTGVFAELGEDYTQQYQGGVNWGSGSGFFPSGSN